MSDASAPVSVPPGAEALSMKSQWAINPMNAPTAVNQILLQLGLPAGEGHNSDGIYLSFGHLQTPVVPQPLTDEMKVQLENTLFTVMPLATFFLTRERLAQFNALISDFLQKTEPPAS